MMVISLVSDRTDIESGISVALFPMVIIAMTIERMSVMFAPALVVIDENNTVVHTECIEELSREPDYPAAFRALGIELAN